MRRPRPRLRPGAQRQAEQLAVLLEAAADRGQRAAGALDLRAHGHRARPRDAQEVHRRRARGPLGVVDGELEPAQHDRHHVAAERPARGVPALGDRAVPDTLAGRAQRGVVVEAHRPRDDIRRRPASMAQMSTAPAAALDLDAIRDRFPALRRRVGGRPVAYFDGPGGSQVPAAVIEAMSGYLERSNANAGGAFASSRETDALLAAAHEAAGGLRRRGSGRDRLRRQHDHAQLPALARGRAHARARRRGDRHRARPRRQRQPLVPGGRGPRPDGSASRRSTRRDGALDLDALEALIGERTRVVAYTLASNALGNVCDSARIAAAAHRVGALAWADGVHLAPHRRLDRDALGADVLLCSPYKFFGPHLGRGGDPPRPGREPAGRPGTRRRPRIRRDTGSRPAP